MYGRPVSFITKVKLSTLSTDCGNSSIEKEPDKIYEGNAKKSKKKRENKSRKNRTKIPTTIKRTESLIASTSQI